MHFHVSPNHYMTLAKAPPPKCICLKTHWTKGTKPVWMMYEKKKFMDSKKRIANMVVLLYDYYASLCENLTSCLSVMSFAIIKRNAISHTFWIEQNGSPEKIYYIEQCFVMWLFKKRTITLNVIVRQTRSIDMQQDLSLIKTAGGLRSFSTLR